MPHDFVPLAELIVDAVLETSPALAGFAGDHRFDDRLPDYSVDGVAADVAMLRDADTALSQVDTEALGADERVDHAVLHALVERALFELTEVREHEWNPLEHNPGALLYNLIARPYADAEQRLMAIGARLATIPDAMDTARAVLHDCPTVHLETAVAQFVGTAGLIRDEIPKLVAEVPELEATITPLRLRAVAALTSFVRWLRGQLDRADDAQRRDPRLGRPLWEARLWHTLDTELSAATILSAARSRIDSVRAELRELAAELTGGPATDATVRAAFDRLAAEHPDDTTIVDLAKTALAEATSFVTEHDLVSMVDDPCVVMEMPEFARGVAVAFCDPAGLLETAEVPTFFCIAPTPAGWPEDRVRSFYREYNNHMVRELAVHEAMPGHYLQMAHARRYRGSTRARALGYSSPFVEGWAVYAEQLMAQAGFGGLPVRMQQLKMQLRMSINAVLDQLAHCDGLAEADGMALLTEQGFQEEGEAAGKWRRALLTSAQLSTYFVGYTEVAAIAAARPAGTPVRAWHDAMLAHGSPPPRHVRSLLGV